ncbi:MAG: tetratricopeptide repeat protein [Leptospiraceae bacterium]|nr:tetratricopeptide repeat protein [Leptospiraceae bacterium]MCK6379929.1 tetratricopeptide repeat protein [Leptospiraceae bacterium]
MKKLIISIIGICLVVSSNVYSVTAGVTVVKTHDSGLDQEKISNSLQTELQKQKGVTIRDRDAFQVAWEQVTQCKAGIVKCDDNNAEMKMLNILVFGDIHKHTDGYIFNLRAVSQKTYSVLYSGSITGKNPDNLVVDLASELNDKFKAIASSETSFEDQEKQGEGGFRIAIYKIKASNEAAQKIPIGNILDSVLTTAFKNKGKFQIVENSRIADIMNEKRLAMSGLVETNAPLFEARGITHYLAGSLKVYNNDRVLSYQIINVKTGLPIVTSMIEWEDEKQLAAAMEEVASKTNEEVFHVNGKLTVEACEPDGVSIFIENKEQGSRLDEIGLCPKTIEDMPKGKYTLVFKHEDRDTMSQEIEIKAMETTKVPLIKMPPIDMSAFQNGGSLEGQGKYQEAIASYQEFYKRYPRHRMSGYAMYREGFITQIYLKNFEKGRKILEDVIKRRPDYEILTEAYTGIAFGYQAAGNSEKSKEIFKMIIEQYPGTSAADAARTCLDTGCRL